jgi:hypothetical protein
METLLCFRTAAGSEFVASMTEGKTQLRVDVAKPISNRVFWSTGPTEPLALPKSPEHVPEPSFLWINKTGTRTPSAERGHPSASEIRSHAQKSSKRRSELDEKARKTRDANPIPVKRQFHNASQASRVAADNSKPGHKSYGMNRSLQPIDTSPLSVDRSAAYLLTFHVQWWCSVMPDLKAWSHRGPAQSPDNHTLQKCFRCPCYMLSVIHFTSVQMKRLGVGSPQALQEDTERLYAKTIRELQNVVCKDEHQQIYMLEVVIYILLAEIHRQRTRAARMHLEAIAILLDRVGGHSRLSNYMEDIIIYSDFYVSLPHLDRPKLGSHIQSNKSCAALPISEGVVFGLERTQEASWIGELDTDVFRWAVDMLLLNMEILTQAWTDQELAVNGHSVRHRCLHIVLRLLEVHRDEGASPDESELDRMTMILYNLVVIAATFEPSGTRGYIPLFSKSAISRYEKKGMNSVVSALEQWNSILGNNAESDLLSSLMDVPSKLEQTGSIRLGKAMSRFVAMEKKKRDARRDTSGLASVRGREHPLRIWQTSSLLC